MAGKANTTAIDKVKTGAEVLDEAADVSAKEARAKKIQEAELATLNAFANVASQAAGMLKAAKTAKPADFQKQESDYWKAEKPGESLQGLYMGFIPDRYITHLIGTLDSKGNPIMMRVKGTKQLTSALGRVKPQTAVRIEFTGTEKTENGTMRKFEVSMLDVSSEA